MKAARVLRFGPPNVITNDDPPQPEPAVGQLLVRVKAAGVGNWDALTREGKLHQSLPVLAEKLVLADTVNAVIDRAYAPFR
jgi:NADPH:quinone reductase-like Zn-dependent oxidoreductase